MSEQSFEDRIADIWLSLQRLRRAVEFGELRPTSFPASPDFVVGILDAAGTLLSAYQGLQEPAMARAFEIDSQERLLDVVVTAKSADPQEG